MLLQIPISFLQASLLDNFIIGGAIIAHEYQASDVTNKFFVDIVNDIAIYQYSTTSLVQINPGSIPPYFPGTGTYIVDVVVTDYRARLFRGYR